MTQPDDHEASVPYEGRQSVDTALRTAQQNTLGLSAMADQKASVVLGAAFVMATIVFGDIAGLDTLEAPRLLLAITSVASGVLAAGAVMPRVSTPSTGGRPNLLFFGTVADLDRDDYFAQMREVLASDELLYEVILDDIHQASVVLHRRKYRLLKLSYLVLIVGMVATLIVTIAT